MQLRGGNSASFAGGLLRTIAGCSAELNVVTNQSRDSGSVKMETGNVPFGEAGHIGIVSGRECCRGGAIVASAGSGPGRSWRGGSADVHAGKSCLSGGGDIYVRGGAGSISEGGGVCFGADSSTASTTGGQVHFKSGGSEIHPGIEKSGRVLVASGLSETDLSAEQQPDNAESDVQSPDFVTAGGVSTKKKKGHQNTFRSRI